MLDPEEVVADYLADPNLARTARRFRSGRQAVRQILLTAGVFKTRRRPSKPALERAWWYIVRDEEYGCWLWMGALGNGYGVMSLFEGPRRITRRVHRLLYEHFIEPLPPWESPDWLEPDHLCRVRCCVNPAHLEVVTKRENIRRSDSASSLNALKTHCPQGHEYTEENTYFVSHRNQRRCRECHRQEARRAHSRKRLDL